MQSRDKQLSYWIESSDRLEEEEKMSSLFDTLIDLH